MALVKKPAASETAGAFEEDETTGTVEADEEVKASPTATDKAKVSASAAIAKAQTTAVGAVAPKMVAVLSDFENALPPVDFGVLPRLKGSQGLILDGDNHKLGSTLQMTLISFNDLYVITTGEDDEASNSLVRYSLDGSTIDSTGEAVSDYIQRLKDVEGYEGAEMKRYCELVGILNSSDVESDHLGNMVQISLSPQSRKAWEAYRLQRSVKIRMGKETVEGSEELTIRAVVKTMGKFTFTVLQVSDK